MRATAGVTDEGLATESRGPRSRPDDRQRDVRTLMTFPVPLTFTVFALPVAALT